jgi:hypothetical protein
VTAVIEGERRLTDADGSARAAANNGNPNIRAAGLSADRHGSAGCGLLESAVANAN